MENLKKKVFFIKNIKKSYTFEMFFFSKFYHKSISESLLQLSDIEKKVILRIKWEKVRTANS